MKIKTTKELIAENATIEIPVKDIDWYMDMILSARNLLHCITYNKMPSEFDILMAHDKCDIIFDALMNIVWERRRQI